MSDNLKSGGKKDEKNIDDAIIFDDCFFNEFKFSIC